MIPLTINTIQKTRIILILKSIIISPRPLSFREHRNNQYQIFNDIKYLNVCDICQFIYPLYGLTLYLLFHLFTFCFNSCNIYYKRGNLQCLNHKKKIFINSSIFILFFLAFTIFQSSIAKAAAIDPLTHSTNQGNI